MIYEDGSKLDCLVSVVAVVNNDQDVVEPFVREVSQVLSSSYTDYEIVLIDQCSSDGTVPIVQSLLTEIHSVRLVGLANQVNRDIALAAGLENAIGDFIVFLDIRQDPVAIIPAAVDLCRSAYDIVIGVAQRPQSNSYRLCRLAADRLIKNLLRYSLPKDATEFRCVSRRAANTVTRTGRFRHSFFVRLAQTGYPSTFLNYTTGSGLPKRSLAEGIRRATRMLIYNSFKPLRWMSALGCMGSLVALIFSLYSLVVHFVTDHVVEGWTTLVLFMSTLFFLLFIVLAIFGEYLGRMLDSVNSPRDYDVAFERNSSVMQVEARYNVLEQSTESVVLGRQKEGACQ